MEVDELDEEEDGGFSPAADLPKVPFNTYRAVLAVALVPAAITLLATSEVAFGVTDNRNLYTVLCDLREAGWHLVGVPVSVAASLVGIGYLLDLHQWHCRCCIWFVGALVGVLVASGMILASLNTPSLAVLLGLLFSSVVNALLPYTVLRNQPRRNIATGISVAYALLSLITAGIWLAWVVNYGFWQKPWEPRIASRRQFGPVMYCTNNVEISLSTWCSPLIMSVGYAMIASFAFMRGQLYVQLPRNRFGVEDVHVGVQLKLALVILVSVGLCAWIAASMSPQDLGVHKLVRTVGVFIFFSLVVYLACSVPLAAVLAEAENSLAVREVLAIMETSWIKGLFILLMGPVLPFWFALELLHEECRRCLGHCRVHAVATSGGCFTAEAEFILGYMKRWDWASVLSKAIMWGIAYFLCGVVVMKGVTVGLSWLNQVSTDWRLSVIIAIIFMVGILLFMLPPVPGQPVYLMAGIIIVQKCIADFGESTGFAIGCVIAVFVSFAIKMLAIVLQQKAIGERWSRSVKLKKFVGVHTMAVKATRQLLSEPGLRPQKVILLLGGPDWPTSVLTGVMRLPLGSMLCGSLPVIFLIAPLVLSAAFMIRASIEERVDEKTMLEGVSKLCLMLAVVLQAACGVLAAYAVQRAAEDYPKQVAAGAWEDRKDIDEDAILALVAEDEARAVWEEKLVGKGKAPRLIVAFLAVGTLCSSAMAAIFALPLPGQLHPFLTFEISSSFSEVLGGDPLAILRPSGWIGVELCAGATSCLVIWAAWRTATLAAASDDESSDEGADEDSCESDDSTDE